MRELYRPMVFTNTIGLTHRFALPTAFWRPRGNTPNPPVMLLNQR